MVKYKNPNIFNKYMKGLIFVLLFITLLCPISALDDLGVFKLGDCVRVTQVCADSTYINISSISYPNSTTALTNTAMSSAGSGEYYYSFCNTNSSGRYDVRGISDGCERTFATYFDITPNGKGAPSGIVITTFFIIFIIILLFTTFMVFYSLGHAVKLDFDIIDLAINYGIFFALVGVKIGENSYLGSVEIGNYLNWAINIGIWLLVILPTIYFILTLTIGSILSKRIKGVDY